MGLDASTTTIGLSILKYDDGYLSLDHYEYYKPPKEGNIFERLGAVREFIVSKINELQPTDVALEEIIQYMKKTTPKTIIALAQLNRTVGLAVYNKTGKPPMLLDVNKIRRTIKLGKLQPKKEEIPDVICAHLDIIFPYVYKKQGKNKGKPADESFDMADSMAVALAYYKLFIEGKDNV